MFCIRRFRDPCRLERDGIGDLAGLRGRLDYLHWLGSTASGSTDLSVAEQDWGYDVSDYYGVHPDLGTLEDLDALIAAAGELGICILLDLVPAHTSDRHAWFIESRSSKESPRRPWYIWSDGAEEQEAVFGGAAWTYDQGTGEYYHHLFLPEQPDLNWMQPEVRDAFDEILRFWFDRGVAGFRIDVVHELVKDPPSQANRPEIHGVRRRWRAIAAGYDPGGLLLGETGSWISTSSRLLRRHGRAQLAFNFPFMFAGLDGTALADVVNAYGGRLPAGSLPVWALSNHDVVRSRRGCVTRTTRRCAARSLLCSRCAGPRSCTTGRARHAAGQDPARQCARCARSRRSRGRHAVGRCRVARSVAPLGGGGGKRRRAASRPRIVLSFCREAIALRRSRDDLVTGGYTPVAARRESGYGGEEAGRRSR